MASITSRGKVLSNFHLFIFLYSRFNSTILRNLFPCNSVNNSFRKWERPLLCYVVNWNLDPLSHILLTLHAADTPLHNFFCKPRTTLGIVMKLFPSGQNFGKNILRLKWFLVRLLSTGKWSIFQSCQNLQTRISR